MPRSHRGRDVPAQMPGFGRRHPGLVRRPRGTQERSRQRRSRPTVRGSGISERDGDWVLFGVPYPLGRLRPRSARERSLASLSKVCESSGEPDHEPHLFAVAENIEEVHKEASIARTAAASGPKPLRRSNGRRNSASRTSPITPSSINVPTNRLWGPRPSRNAAPYVTPEARMASRVYETGKLAKPTPVTGAEPKMCNPTDQMSVRPAPPVDTAFPLRSATRFRPLGPGTRQGAGSGCRRPRAISGEPGAAAPRTEHADPGRDPGSARTRHHDADGGEDGDATGENSSIATHRLVHGEDQRRKQHGCKLGRVLTLDCANSGSGHPPPR